MTSRADFSDEEWERLERAPLLAGMAISFADPGGAIGAIKESTAALRAVRETASEGDFGGLVRSLAGDVAAKTERRENPMAGFTPDRRRALDDVLDELRAVNALLVDRVTDEEMEDFREWIKITSQRVALAAKEGSFLGIGGRRVSEREQQMLETLGEIFGVPRSSPP